MPTLPVSPLRGVALATLATLAATLLVPATARAETFHHCTGFIDALPAVVSTQGTWCLRADLSTDITSGQAILVSTNNATVDCNGFKVGGLSAGQGTAAYGIRADSRRNVTVRNCHVRGFLRGILLNGAAVYGGHLAEDNRVEYSTLTGIWVYGDGSVVRRNLVIDTGGASAYPTGISTAGRVSVLDNTVVGVDSSAAPAYSNTFGISLNFPGGTVSGNRVSGLVRAAEGSIYGIYASNAGDGDGLIASGNHVIGDGGIGMGVSCNGNGIAAGNLVLGLAYGVGSCTDGGANAHAP